MRNTDLVNIRGPILETPRESRRGHRSIPWHSSRRSTSSNKRPGRQELMGSADAMDVFGYKVSFASLDDLIRMKRAAGRPKNRVELEILGALRQEIDEQQGHA